MLSLACCSECLSDATILSVNLLTIATSMGMRDSALLSKALIESPTLRTGGSPAIVDFRLRVDDAAILRMS